MGASDYWGAKAKNTIAAGAALLSVLTSYAAPLADGSITESKNDHTAPITKLPNLTITGVTPSPLAYSHQTSGFFNPVALENFDLHNSGASLVRPDKKTPVGATKSVQDAFEKNKLVTKAEKKSPTALLKPSVKAVVDAKNEIAEVNVPACFAKADIEKLYNDYAVVEALTDFPTEKMMTFAYIESCMGTNKNAGNDILQNNSAPFAYQIKSVGPKVLETIEENTSKTATSITLKQDKVRFVRKNGELQQGKSGHVVSKPRMDDLVYAVNLMNKNGGIPKNKAQKNVVSRVKEFPFFPAIISAEHIKDRLPAIYTKIEKQNPEAAKLMKDGLDYALHNLGDGGLANLANNLNAKALPILNKSKATSNKIALFKITATDSCLDALLKITLPVIEAQKVMEQEMVLAGLKEAPKNALRVAWNRTGSHQTHNY